MRKEFMKVAKSVGTFLTAGVLALGVTFSAQAQDELPLPAFPASFEVAEYQGQKGCIPDDKRYKFAVMENEGLHLAGMHPLLDTAKTGVHIMNFLYQPEKNYGYTLSYRNDGKQCIYNKVNDVRFGDELTNIFTTVSVQSPITAKDCNFDVQAINICGSYEAVTGRLKRAGYEYDWQGTLDSDYKLTLMTKGEQSFYLKTDGGTGATIITGVGKGAYVPHDVPKSTPHLVAKN
jgi:hypothetical protein